MPFCSGMTAVCGPTIARICSATLSKSHNLTQQRTTSTVADPGDIVGGLDRLDVDFAAVPFDAKSILAHRREMGAARYEGHVRPGFCERSSIGPADTAGADHGDAHPRPPSSKADELLPTYMSRSRAKRAFF